MVAANNQSRRPASVTGRPRIILAEERALIALHMLARRISFRKVAEDIGVKRRWLADAYHDGRLHDMAGQRAEGEIPRPSSFVFATLEEKREGPS